MREGRRAITVITLYCFSSSRQAMVVVAGVEGRGDKEKTRSRKKNNGGRNTGEDNDAAQ